LKTLKVFSVGDRDSGGLKDFRVFRGGQVAIPPPPYIYTMLYIFGRFWSVYQLGAGL